MLGICNPLDAAVFEKLEDAEDFCIDVMIDDYDRRLGLSDACIEPFKGLVDCGTAPDPALLEDIKRICESEGAEGQERKRQRMKTGNPHHYATAVIGVTHFVSLVCAPLSSFSQKIDTEHISKQLQQCQERYSALADRCTTLARQHLDSNKREHKMDLLITVGTGLQRADFELSALQGYWFLVGMVNEEEMINAIAFVKSQYNFIKRRTEVSIHFIEKTIHTSNDQETTRLLLQARDLHRSLVGYLTISVE